MSKQKTSSSLFFRLAVKVGSAFLAFSTVSMWSSLRPRARVALEPQSHVFLPQKFDPVRCRLLICASTEGEERKLNSLFFS